ncbi:DEHA2G10538p [Debaryomyces hansenii CBS767]|uniref:DEHA2G10538p n=1 Tax=Debaryomyces hansenii (strain ATCC 36239 / CBS 767 / BCRC 21394 / JCM 1990 / NBRC 0083 / IGC 2968) TaxID=284592 RepID=B5RUQ0_DEBHA|nr:DEHA2G10538p [Debaryomyces hansenii CBS767]CAR65944.1 DEHA2G10538p [Debaryomyces hansenii CBS767]|eukprot:XP_002770609.1 DEHA2G10538p [Debaryomyces hansenii CBS767]
MVSTNKASYPKSTFKKVLNSKTKYKFKNDESDLLIYLLYVDYVNKLMNKGRDIQERAGSAEISTNHLELANNELSKHYRG